MIPGEGLQVPAAIGGKPGDAVPAGRDEVPVLLRGTRLAGEPAGHADDHHRVVRGAGRNRGEDRRIGLLPPPQQLGDEVFGQHPWPRVVEEQTRGQRQAGGVGQLVAQFHRGQRVEPVVLERPVRADGLRVGVSEYGGGMGPYDVQQHRPPLGRRGGEEALAQLRHRGLAVAPGFPCRPCGRAGAGQSGERGTGTEAEQGLQQLGLPEVGDGRGRVRFGHQLGHRLHREPWIEDGGSGRLRRSGPSPGAPGDRGRREALCPAALGERVQHRVPGGVVRPARAADGGGHRGEQREHRQVEVAGQLVQQQGGLDLGPEHVLETPRGQTVERGGLFQVTGRVHDTGQRELRPGRRQHRFQSGPVRRVADRDRDPRAERGQFGLQLRRTGRVRPRTGEQQQVFRAVPGQPARHVRAHRPGALGDQHRAGRLPPPCRVPCGRGNQTPAEDP